MEDFGLGGFFVAPFGVLLVDSFPEGAASVFELGDNGKKGVCLVL